MNGCRNLGKSRKLPQNGGLRPFRAEFLLFAVFRQSNYISVDIGQFVSSASLADYLFTAGR